MAKLYMVENDTEPTRVTFQDEDLTGFSAIVGHLQKDGAPNETVPTTILVAADGTFQLDWGVGQLTVGTHGLEIQFTRLNGDILTIPGRKAISVIVRPELDP